MTIKEPVKHYIDFNNWNRKEHFDFFIKFDNPIFSITSNVECSKSYQFAKEKKLKFYPLYLYLSLKIFKQIDELRYRLENDKIACYDYVNAASTVLRDDKTIGFSLIYYHDDFKDYYEDFTLETNRVRQEKGLKIPESGNGVVYYSTLPWISYTSLKHATSSLSDISIPRVVFGKYNKNNDKMYMPVSLDVHHALADGYHAGLFYNQLQNALNNPADYT